LVQSGSDVALELRRRPCGLVHVYVGSPNDVAYDTDRRWFSEVLNMGNPYQELFHVVGQVPVRSGGHRALAGLLGHHAGGWQGARGLPRQDEPRACGPVDEHRDGLNSKDGAAVIDAVQVDGGTTLWLRRRRWTSRRVSLAGDISLGGTPWVTT
jgi:hypothetical protein